MIGRSDFSSGIVGRRDRDRLLSEINVTPMVDVMLVLLIIFIVTGQMVVTGTDVELPDARADQIALKEEPIQVSIDAQGNIFVAETLLAPEAFSDVIAALASAKEGAEERRVLVRADRSLPYGRVMEIVSLISEAGFSKVAFISEPVPAPDVAEAP